MRNIIIIAEADLGCKVNCCADNFRPWFSFSWLRLSYRILCLYSEYTTPALKVISCTNGADWLYGTDRELSMKRRGMQPYSFHMGCIKKVRRFFLYLFVYFFCAVYAQIKEKSSFDPLTILASAIFSKIIGFNFGRLCRCCFLKLGS